jgi:hypothetical protein
MERKIRVGARQLSFSLTLYTSPLIPTATPRTLRTTAAISISSISSISPAFSNL